MKRLLTVALVLLVCACCLTSCAKIEQEIGKSVSVSAVDAVAAELDKKGVEYERLDEQDFAEFTADWKETFEVDMAGEITSGLIGSYENQETGAWVKYWTLGFSATADADTFEQIVRDEYQTEIDQGKAIVVNGGYIVNVTISSAVIEQD